FWTVIVLLAAHKKLLLFSPRWIVPPLIVMLALALNAQAPPLLRSIKPVALTVVVAVLVVYVPLEMSWSVAALPVALPTVRAPVPDCVSAEPVPLMMRLQRLGAALPPVRVTAEL